MDWVLKIFGTQVTKQKRPVRPVFPDYLSASYDYGIMLGNLKLDVLLEDLSDQFGISAAHCGRVYNC